jgi:hypothetical protein
MNPQDILNDLVGQVVVVLTAAAPFLNQAASQVVGEITKESLHKAHDLYAKVRQRFQADHNDNAEKALDLFVDDPESFEVGLSKYLLQALQAHPEWATEIRALLAQPSTQEIIARNKSTLERVTQSLAGAGTQRIEVDNSQLKDVKQVKK